MSPSTAFALLSVLFLLTSVGIALKQRAAKSCPRHHRTVGLVARILAWVCLLTGLVLAGLALATA